jgi:hypothetical protein
MKMQFIFLLVLPYIFACNTASKNNPEVSAKIIFTPEDEIIFNNIINQLFDQKDAPTSDLMIKAGTLLLNTSYADHTLEHEPEQLVINLREMDCTTFIENCMALARTLKSNNPDFEQFARELQNIRYRDGKINDYSSRLHYFSDWIYTNSSKNLVNDVSKEITDSPYQLNLNFMSTHPASYKQLRDSTLIQVVARLEKEISAREMYFIPKNRLSEFEDKLLDGDIAAITTDIEGLDVSHTVLLIRKNGRIHILHASSTAGKIVISDETLEVYVMNNKRTTGIMVARPL